MLSIQQIREKRAAKAKEARAILDAAGDDFNNQAKPERKQDKAKIDALYAEIDRLDSQIETVERQLALEAESDTPTRDEMNGNRLLDEDRAKPEVRARAIFDKWVRGGLQNLDRDDIDFMKSVPRSEQSAKDASKGGYTAPEEFAATLLERLAEFGGVRQSGATVLQTSGGNDIDWPTTDETNEEGEIVGENQQASSGDLNFGTVGIRAHKYSSKVIVVPIELLQDTRIDLIGFINRAQANRIARIQNRHFTTGTGTNQPKGFITAAAVGKTTVGGQTTTIIFEDLVDLEHSIDPAYRASGRCRWQFNDGILKAFKKLKDTTGRPLWLPGLSASDPDTLLRYPYTINQHMASSIAASQKTVAFGDFSKYMIRDVMGVTLLRFDDSRYGEKGQVAFLAFARGDGNVIDALDANGQSGAFKVLQQAGS